MHINLRRKGLRQAARIGSGVLSLALAVFFFRHEGHELLDIGARLRSAHPGWVALGLAATALYLVLQTAMYVFCFRAVGRSVRWSDAGSLFLKRNLVSVFLPAGGFTSLGLYTKQLEERDVPRSSIHFASAIYATAGLFTVFVVAAPVFFYLLLVHGLSTDERYAFAALVLLLLGVYALVRTLGAKGRLATWLILLDPSLDQLFTDLRDGRVHKRELLYVVLISLLIEFVGITHLYIAMKALGIGVGWEVAVIGYVVAVLLLIASPFMRGLGAIEVSLVLILVQYKVEQAFAISAMLLYRVFEFWLPLLAGLIAFVRGRHNILLRLFPASMVFVLGVVNIASAASPALKERLAVLRTMIPTQAIEGSTVTVLLSGFVLLFVTTMLVRGLRSAWWFASGLALLSMLGHVAKGIDYEEAAFALLTLAVLLYTHRSYVVPTDPRARTLGLPVFAALCFSAVLYGTIGFYFLDTRHFGIDFTVMEAVIATIERITNLGHSVPEPLTVFGGHFLISIQVLGGVAIVSGVLVLLKPWSGGI